MKAIYQPTGEVVEILGLSSSGMFTRISHFGSEQYVATGCLQPVEEIVAKPVAATPAKKKAAKATSCDEVTLFLREMETEKDLQGVCKDVGIDYPVRSSMGLTKMAIGNALRKLIKNGEYELEWA